VRLARPDRQQGGRERASCANARGGACRERGCGLRAVQVIAEAVSQHGLVKLYVASGLRVAAWRGIDEAVREILPVVPRRERLVGGGGFQLREMRHAHRERFRDTVCLGDPSSALCLSRSTSRL
jgi:hypothetical protein